jgi:uncharacterized protein (DUF983 family)
MRSPTEFPSYKKQDTDLQPVVEHVTVLRRSLCPQCGDGKLDYNGLLDLECDHCGYSLTEGAGCS